MDSSAFMPHGYCYLWRPGLLGLHVVSDGAIFIAYFTISVALWYFVRQRQDLVFRYIFLLFGAFILACGLTHLLNVWNVWVPDYWLSGLVKAITASVSLATAIVLWPLIPRALSMASPEQLRELNDELTVISNHLVVVQERGRAVIAHELHDELGSLLTALSLDLHRIKQHLTPGDPQAAAALGSAFGLVDEAVQIERRVVEKLRPSILDNVGICAALRWLADDFGTRTGIVMDISIPQEEMSLDARLAIDIYRVAQESLTNVVRHAGATGVSLVVEVTGDQFNLTIRDNGHGFDFEARKTLSHGLRGMRHRIQRWGGTFAIHTSAGAGTEIRASVRVIPAGDGADPVDPYPELMPV